MKNGQHYSGINKLPTTNNHQQPLSMSYKPRAMTHDLRPTAIYRLMSDVRCLTSILYLAKMSIDNLKDYWHHNVRYLVILLIIWFLVSYGCGILFVDSLNQYNLGGFPLGFWFAQQGSIYIFVILIFVYVWLMNRLDHRYNVDEE